MFKAIINFIRRLREPKPGQCPKVLDYEWTTQEGTDVRVHEPTRTGKDPVETLEKAVKASQQSAEPRLVAKPRRTRTVKKVQETENETPKEKTVTEKKPTSVKKVTTKKATAKKAVPKKTVKVEASDNVLPKTEEQKPLEVAEKVKATKTVRRPRKTTAKTATSEEKKTVKKVAPKKRATVKTEVAEKDSPSSNVTATKKIVAKKTATSKKTVADKEVAAKEAKTESVTEKEPVKAEVNASKEEN